MATRQDLQLAQGRVSYLEQGQPSAHRPSLVLIHGLMGTAATFEPFLRALPRDRHVVAVDLPGAGYSERDLEADATLAAASACTREILAALKLDRPVLLGHSHGGAVGLHLAASAPGLLRSLVLLAPAHPYFRHADRLIGFYLSPWGRAFAYTIPWYPRWLQRIGLRQMAGPRSWDSPERLVPYRENLRVRGTIGHLLRLLRTWHADMHELELLLESGLQLPTLLLWGDHDRAVPLSTANALRQRLTCSELAILKGVGHRPAEEQPDACVEYVESWCERMPQASDDQRLSVAD